jgi:thiol:disulfide interchange protein DsbD
VIRRNRLPALLLLVAASVLAFTSKASADGLGDLSESFRQALEHGSLTTALGLIFFAGLMTSLTPCVYPMIAITVSVFGAREAKSRSEAAVLSTAFVLGIAAMFTPLGVLSSITGQAMGGTQANPWIMVPLAIVFAAMAVSMFGGFDMDLPDGLKNRLAQLGGSGVKGAFALGFASGLVAAPCTGPVLTVLFSWVATTRDVGFGALSFFVYSLGLGVLFWVVGTFAVGLPKSGRWLEWVKSLFGVVMLVLALHYVRGFLPSPFPVERSSLWLGAALAVLFASIPLGAIHLSFKDGPRMSRLRKGAGVAAATCASVALIGWTEALPPGAHIEWREDFAAAKADAEQAGKPMLVDFGADWCGACNELEHETFSDPRVVAEAQGFVTVRVDLSADTQTPEKWAFLRSYGQNGLPFVVLHDTSGREAIRITGLVSADEFLDQMRRALR